MSGEKSAVTFTAYVCCLLLLLIRTFHVQFNKVTDSNCGGAGGAGGGGGG